MKHIRYTAVFIALMFILSAIPSLADDEITVYLDDEKLSFDAAPRMDNDRTLVPMRVIFEKLGYTVQWDEAAGAINAYQQSRSSFWAMDMSMVSTIHLEIGSNLMNVSTVQYISTGISRMPFASYDDTVPLDCTPKLYDDRTFVPLRAIAEATGCAVDWNADENAVYIKTGVSGNAIQQNNATSGNEVFL